MEALKARWLHLAAEVGIAQQAVAVWLQLAAAYSADGRFYHNLHHIQYVLDIADHLQNTAANFTAVQLAIWFHDVVYDPRRSDNEAQSADFARQTLQPLGVPDALLALVSDLILVTQTHETAVTNPDACIMLDADLAILGELPEKYDAYARAIRQEYSFVPEAAYRAGRTAVLQRFLGRRPFFYTAWMQQTRETAVRQNILRELRKLEDDQ